MKIGKYYKLPDWARDRLKRLANAYEVSETEALLRCIDQGSKWHEKNIRNKINRDFKLFPEKPGVVLENYNVQSEYETRIATTMMNHHMDREEAVHALKGLGVLPKDYE